MTPFRRARHPLLRTPSTLAPAPSLTPPQREVLAVLGRIAREEIRFSNGEPVRRARLSTRTDASRPWAVKVNSNAAHSLERLGLAEIILADLYGQEVLITEIGTQVLGTLDALGRHS